MQVQRGRGERLDGLAYAARLQQAKTQQNQETHRIGEGGASNVRLSRTVGLPG